MAGEKTNPAMNGLLLPDFESLPGRKKPFEWTWTQGRSVDDVAATIDAGLQQILEELVVRQWGVPEPQKGRIPDAERPNVVIAIARPLVVQSPEILIVPAFSSAEYANEFYEKHCVGKISSDSYGLYNLPTCADKSGNACISLSMHGAFDNLPP